MATQTRVSHLLLLASFCLNLFQLSSYGQSATAASMTAVQAAPPANSVNDYEFTCPGSFPSDLKVVNCEYTTWQRLHDFVSNGLTDKALLLSMTGSVFTTAIRTPAEWPGTWKYYGYRVGASYTQSAGNSAAQLIVGGLIHDDPRHVACDHDPLLFGILNAEQILAFHCSPGRRLRHAFLDSVTMRLSYAGQLPPENSYKAVATYKHVYRRLPAISRLVGSYAGAYAQYPWEPRKANTFGAVSQRAALSFAPAFLGSFWTEYSSSLFSYLKRARQ